jgi:hypothetical protein
VEFVVQPLSEQEWQEILAVESRVRVVGNN